MSYVRYVVFLAAFAFFLFGVTAWPLPFTAGVVTATVLFQLLHFDYHGFWFNPKTRTNLNGYEPRYRNKP